MSEILRVLNSMDAQLDVLQLIAKDKGHYFELTISSEHNYCITVKRSPQ
jgi:hypothetical protein